jgi:hypothetical protein
MGTQKQGILGGFSGKTGPVVGSYHKGQNTIRALPHKTSRPPSQKQLNQLNKFSFLVNFLSYISDLIEVGFKNHKITLSPMNAAVTYNFKYAITATGTPPVYSINPLQLSFSRGKLIGPKNSSVESVATAKIKFEWTANSGSTPLNNPLDQLTVMVYNPSKQEFVTLMNAVPRSALSYTLNCPVDFIGDDVYCYMAFTGVNGKVSNSIYAGTVAIL